MRRSLLECHCAIIINTCDRIGPCVVVTPVLAVRVLVYQNLVSDRVGMRSARSILSFVVLDDKPLLTLLDVLPICSEISVVDRIATEH